MYYKLGQACVTNWGSFVLLQIKANVVTITNWAKTYYKLGQILQMRVNITNRGRISQSWNDGQWAFAKFFSCTRIFIFIFIFIVEKEMDTHPKNR